MTPQLAALAPRLALEWSGGPAPTSEASRVSSHRATRAAGRGAGVPGGTRLAILDAAEALFYGEGIRSATMDAIAERAGVTKRTLYHHFRSKDDLVAACLNRLGGAERDRYAATMRALPGAVEDRVRGLFSALAQDVLDPRWKGCCFARAAGELAGLPGHPGAAAARAHRKAVEAWLASVFGLEGLAEADTLARRLVLLLDGAIVQGFLHHDPAYALDAGEMAAQLVALHRRVPSGVASAPRSEAIRGVPNV